MSGSARDVVLGRVRTALAQDRRAGDAEGAWAALPRNYTATDRMALQDRLLLLEDRLRDYDAVVQRVASEQIAEAIASAFAARGSLPTVVPPGFPPNWLPRAANLVLDEGFSARELDRFDGVVTAATLAIAETGTLVLQNVPGQGRRAATLVPDFHLCVVRAADVVGTVPEAFAKLRGGARELPTTFISGPSATADIEMTRVKGVHGPQFLEVLIVEETFT